MSSYYNQGVQVIIGNGQNFPGTPRISLIPFIQNAYDKGLLNFTVLPPGSISLAEIQDISTAKILGRSTAGSGVIEQISIGTGLSLSGGILSSTATATPGGSDTQIQYNNAGAFAGSSNLVTTATNTLDIQGSGSTSATNALRVRNSAGTEITKIDNSGTTTYLNNSPIYFKRADNTTIGQIIPSNAGIAFGSNTATQMALENGGSVCVGNTTKANYPALFLNGTGYSGGTATTTKPTLLIEPTGTTSTGWSTSGTKLGVNAESGFTGDLFNGQVNGVEVFRVRANGNMNIIGGLTVPTGTINCGSDVISSQYFGASGKSWLRSATDGNWTMYNNAVNNFSLLQFGGTTSSFPAIKRNGAGLDIRLADDSGYGLFNTGKTTIYGSGATSATSSLIVQNSSGTDLLKVRDDGVVKIGSFTEGYTTGYGLILTNDIKCNAINFRSPTVGDGTIYGLDGSAPNGVRIITGGIANYIFKGVGANFDPCMLMITGFNPSSGSSDKNMNYFNPSLQITGTYSGTVRNLYVNASISTLASARYIDIEATKGDVLFNTTSGSTAIGTSTITTNAKLEVVSTSKGFLPPRLTTTQRDAVTWVAGDAGMIIFNTTTSKHQGWDGSVWNDLY